MAFIPVANVAQANIRQTLNGERIENTLYFRAPAAWSAGSLAALASGVAAWWTTGPRAVLSDDLVLREVYVVDLTTANSGTYTHTVVNDPGGPISGEALPNNCALCVSFRTANRGRSFRGRNYVAGINEGDVTGNVVAQATANGILAGYQGLMTYFSEAGLDWVVVSRYANGQPRAAGVATPVNAVTLVDRYIDSQRRRLPGRGA